jgi:hypothetical protein
MSFPAGEHGSPHEISAAVQTASFAQDVVAATNRIVHEQPPGERDSSVLSACREVLARLASSDVTIGRSSQRRLAAAESTVAALRAVRARQETRADLKKLIGAIDRLTTGERDAEAVAQAAILRQTFVQVGEANLKRLRSGRRDQEPPEGWTPLIANSLS